MSIGKALGRVGIVVLVAVAVGLIGCDGNEENNPGGGNNSTTVKINGLTWMNKNLDMETPGSWCYDNKESNCEKYGRLYLWESANSACAHMGDGYRLPTKEDWQNLITYAFGASYAGKRLKSKSGWDNNGNGTDDYGFSAMPGGVRSSGSAPFFGIGTGGWWWSATEASATAAYRVKMSADNDHVEEYDSILKSDAMSVRCVQD